MPDQINADGLLIRFGNDQGRRINTTKVTTDTTKVNELVYFVTLTGAARTIYPGNGLSQFTGNDTPIPATAKILDINTLVVETPAGGTNYIVGTYQLNGTAIDDDGLLTTAGAAGAQVGTVVGQDGYVATKTTGTYTAGRIKVVVRYLIR